MDIKLNNQNAVIYARYSSESQTEQSIEGQVRVITDYAKSNNIPIIDTYIDRAITGTSDKRPEFQRMIADAKNKNFGYVLVYKFDRFSRDRLNSLVYKRELKKNGVKVVSVTEYISDDPQGILFESIIDGYSEFYSAELSQKVRRGNRESRMKGLYTGGYVLYGYKVVDKKYVIVEEEAEIIKKIFIDAARGVTYPDISDNLNSKGIKHRNKPFTSSFIHKVLHNKKYIGIVETHGEIFDNIVPAIIDKETFDRACTTSASNHIRGAHYKAKKEYLLSGKVFCGYCGAIVTAEGGKNARGNVFNYYKCSTIKIKKQKCELRTFRKEQLEEMVVEKVKKLFLENSDLEKIAEYICKAYNSMVVDDTALKSNERSLDKAKREIDNIVNAIASGIINDALKIRLDELQEEKTKLEIENVKLKTRNKTRLTINDVLRFLESMKEMNNETSAYNKRMIQRFIKKVVLYNNHMEVYLVPIIRMDNDGSEDKKEVYDDLANAQVVIENGLLILKFMIS